MIDANNKNNHPETKINLDSYNDLLPGQHCSGIYLAIRREKYDERAISTREIWESFNRNPNQNVKVLFVCLSSCYKIKYLFKVNSFVSLHGNERVDDKSHPKDLCAGIHRI